MRPVTNLSDLRGTIENVIMQLASAPSTQDLVRSIALLRETQGFTGRLPEYGLTQDDYVKLRTYLETKIKGLAGSAGEEALKFVDTGSDGNRLMAKKYQAEETALREVLRELNDRRNMTLQVVGS